MNILCNLISFAFGAAVCAAAYRYRNQLLEVSRLLMRKIKQQNEPAGEKLHYYEFSICATRFSGMYEPLYKAVKAADDSKLEKLIDQWSVRVASQSSSDLSSWWHSTIESENITLLNKGERILSMIEENGIKRDSRKVLRLTSKDLQLYCNIDNEEISEGMNVNIVSPCWYIDSDPVLVIEQGYIENQN